jgi:F0F1-type ATP synthase assembly protein I
MTGFDLSAKRELNNGFGNALSTAVELAVTPAVLAFAGWQLDRWLGTSPIFLIALFVFTFCYVAWKQYVLYGSKMRQQHEALFGPRTERTEP